MPTITFDIAQPDRGPAVGILDWEPTRRHIDGTTVVATSPKLLVKIPGGPVTAEIPATGPGWCWKVTERIGTNVVRYVLVTGDANYAELVEVDPKTLEPTAEPEAAWWLATMDLERRLDDIPSADPTPWPDIPDRPAVVAEGATQAAARAAIGAVGVDDIPPSEPTPWDAIPDKPDVVAAGSTATQAREAIGATAPADVRAITAAEAGIDSTQRLMAVLRNETADSSVLFVGDSTGNEPTEWIYLLTGLVAAQWPRWTVNYRLWNGTSSTYDPAVTIQAGTGPRTLTIYNASIAGTRTDSWLGSRADAALFTLDPKMVVVSLGHNEQDIAPSVWHGRYAALTEEISLRLPGADLLLILQNPATGNARQQARAEIYREIAARRGYGLVDVQQAFLDTGNAAGLTLDGIHPNPAGSALWAATVAKAFVYQAGRSPRPQLPSSLTEASENLLTNGTFAAFSGAVPDGWTATAATCTKDTTDYESGNGYSVKLTANGTATADLSQYIPVRRVRGQWVTLAVRIRVPVGSTAAVGRVGISAGGVSSIDLGAPDDGARGRFRWAVMSHFVPVGAANCRALLYIDSGTGTGTCSIDRAWMGVGKFPRDSAR